MIGSILSPMPEKNELLPSTQTATSAPRNCANSEISRCDKLTSQNSHKAFKVAAASADPPPIPAATG